MPARKRAASSVKALKLRHCGSALAGPPAQAPRTGDSATSGREWLRPAAQMFRRSYHRKPSACLERPRGAGPCRARRPHRGRERFPGVGGNSNRPAQPTGGHDHRLGMREASDFDSSGPTDAAGRQGRGARPGDLAAGSKRIGLAKRRDVGWQEKGAPSARSSMMIAGGVICGLITCFPAGHPAATAKSGPIIGLYFRLLDQRLIAEYRLWSAPPHLRWSPLF